MKGMEIFSTDDVSEEFMEFDDSLVGSDVTQGIDPITNVDDIEVNEPTKKNKKEDESNTDSDELEIQDEEGLEVLLPSGKSINTDKETSSDSSTLSPKFFSSLVQALKEGGILEDVQEKDIKSQEDFFTVIEESIKAREFADLTEDQRTYLEALREGIPHEEIVAHQRNIDAYNSITEEAITEETTDGEDLRRTVIMNNFIAKGIAEAKAKKLADKIFDAGEDVEEAREALNELKETEKNHFNTEKANRATQKANQEKKEKEAIEKLHSVVKETKELIPGLQIPQALKTNIIKGLTQPVAFTEDNRPLDIISKYLYDNPIDGRFKLAYILSVTDGMKKMNVLESKKSKNNAFRDLENALRTSDNGGSLMFDGDESQPSEGFNLNDYKFI